MTTWWSNITGRRGHHRQDRTPESDCPATRYLRWGLPSRTPWDLSQVCRADRAARGRRGGGGLAPSARAATRGSIAASRPACAACSDQSDPGRARAPRARPVRSGVQRPARAHGRVRGAALDVMAGPSPATCTPTAAAGARRLATPAGDRRLVIGPDAGRTRSTASRSTRLRRGLEKASALLSSLCTRSRLGCRSPTCAVLRDPRYPRHAGPARPSKSRFSSPGPLPARPRPGRHAPLISSSPRATCKVVTRARSSTLNSYDAFLTPTWPCPHGPRWFDEVNRRRTSSPISCSPPFYRPLQRVPAAVLQRSCCTGATTAFDPL